MKNILTLLITFSSLFVNAQGTLIASSTYYTPGNDEIPVLVDTTSLGWSDSRKEVQHVKKGEVSVYDFDFLLKQKNLPHGLQNDTRQLQTFDIGGNIISTLSQKWNADISIWENLQKTEHIFTSGLKTTSVDFSWNGTTSIWENVSKTTYVYVSGILAESEHFNWNTSTNSWDNFSKNQYTLVSGKLTEQINLFWNNTSSRYENKTYEQYNYIGPSIKWSKFLLQSWNPVSSTWENTSQTDIQETSSISKKVVIIYIKHWNNISNEWDSTSRNHFIYFGTSSWGDFLQEESLEQYNNTINQWENKTRSKYSYSSYFLEAKSTQVWDKAISFWMPETLYEYYFNSDSTISEVYERPHDETGADPMTITYYYYQPTSDVTRLNQDLHPASLYPNPANTANVYLDYFTEKAEASEIVLTNILGQELFRFSEKAAIGDHSVRIPVASLSPGLYLVSIYSKGALNQALKLVK